MDHDAVVDYLRANSGCAQVLSLKFFLGIFFNQNIARVVLNKQNKKFSGKSPIKSHPLQSLLLNVKIYTIYMYKYELMTRRWLFRNNQVKMNE